MSILENANHGFAPLPARHPETAGRPENNSGDKISKRGLSLIIKRSLEHLKSGLYTLHKMPSADSLMSGNGKLKMQVGMHRGKTFATVYARQLPTPPRNTEINSVFRQRLKKRSNLQNHYRPFKFGGFKGWDSLDENDKSYAEWALNLRDEATGAIRQFQKFCKEARAAGVEHTADEAVAAHILEECEPLVVHAMEINVGKKTVLFKSIAAIFN